MRTTSLTTDDPGVSPSEVSPDGRSLRRERNVAAARAAAIELLGEGAHPSLAEIAERAGVATRSVYRYFGDAESAIADAVRHRLTRAREVFDSEPTIGAAMPFEERLGMLILRRLRLERLMEPISTHALTAAYTIEESPIDDLDGEVRTAFAPELERAATDVQLELILCGLFRLRSVRSMRGAFDDSDGAVASALSRTVTALLADAERRAGR